MKTEMPVRGPHASSTYHAPLSRQCCSMRPANLASSLIHPTVIATSSQRARISGTLHEKHAAHVEAAAPPRLPTSMVGVAAPPLVAPPYRRPVVGLSSASIVELTCLDTSGMLEKVVNISAPTSPFS